MSISNKIMNAIEANSDTLGEIIETILSGGSNNVIHIENRDGWDRLISIDVDEDLAEIVDVNRYTGAKTKMAVTASDLLYSDLC